MVQRLHQLKVFFGAIFDRFVFLGRFQKLDFFVLIEAIFILDFILAVGQVLGQVGFTQSQAIDAIAFGRFVDHQVRYDTLGLNGAAAWRVITGCRQLDCRIFGKWTDRLNGSFAEGLGAHDGGALVILQGACDNFGCGSRTDIDQYDDRNVLDLGWQFCQGIVQRSSGIVFRTGIKDRFRFR